MPSRAVRAAVRAAHGLGDADASALVAYAEGRGWHVPVEVVEHPTTWTRYRATVWKSADPRAGRHAASAWRGRGLTEAAAVGAALASALAHEAAAAT